MDDLKARLRLAWPRTTRLIDKYPVVSGLVFVAGMVVGGILALLVA